MVAAVTLAERSGLTMRARHLGRRTDADGWEHDAWSVTLAGDGAPRSIRVPYRMGTAHDGQPPTLDDVLDDLVSEAAAYESAASFEEWASECGYDTDSRRAARLYRAVDRQSDRLRALLGPERYWHLIRGDA